MFNSENQKNNTLRKFLKTFSVSPAMTKIDISIFMVGDRISQCTYNVIFFFFEVGIQIEFCHVKFSNVTF